MPAAVVAKLGPSKKLAVKVAFNRYTLQGWIDDGGFMIPISAQVRDAAGVVAGQKADSMSSSTARPARSRCRPTSRAVGRDAATKPFFEGLSSSNKQRIVISIQAAKAADTSETHRESHRRHTGGPTLVAVRQEMERAEAAVINPDSRSS